MRLVLQRVLRASVRVHETVIAQTGAGFLVLVGIHQTDNFASAEHLAARCADLRIFDDESGQMNRSIVDINGEALAVSQFTLYGDCRKGRRPSFSDAAPADLARPLYERFVDVLRQRIGRVQTGAFGAEMEVELVNNGPVTFVLEHLTT